MDTTRILRYWDIGWLGKSTIKKIPSWTKTSTRKGIMSYRKWRQHEDLSPCTEAASCNHCGYIGRSKPIKTFMSQGIVRYSSGTKWALDFEKPAITLQASLSDSLWYNVWTLLSKCLVKVFTCQGAKPSLPALCTARVQLWVTLHASTSVAARTSFMAKDSWDSDS